MKTKKRKDKNLYNECAPYSYVAHESHKFERVYTGMSKIWGGYSICKCGAQRYHDVLGPKCQQAATEPCPLSETKD